PHGIVVPLDGIHLAAGEIRRTVSRYRVVGLKVGAEPARAVFGPLEVKTVLNDVAAVKGGAGGIITIGVHRQTAGNFGQGVKAPFNLFAIQDVRLTHLVRRVGQTSFIKQGAVV